MDLDDIHGWEVIAFEDLEPVRRDDDVPADVTEERQITAHREKFRLDCLPPGYRKTLYLGSAVGMLRMIHKLTDRTRIADALAENASVQVDGGREAALRPVVGRVRCHYANALDCSRDERL